MVAAPQQTAWDEWLAILRTGGPVRTIGPEDRAISTTQKFDSGLGAFANCGGEYSRRAWCGNCARRDLCRGGRLTGRAYGGEGKKNMQFFDHPIVLIVVGILSLPLYFTLAQIFFGDKFESLGETIKYLIWPDWYSLLRGRFWEDYFASTKFYIFIFMCFGWAASVTELLARHVL
ncbi:hypothetical protein [uncultured Desulfuromonas sp.]|uniref:hypothetical protein n=1 Tax=uncultured Desulfuromonas sp. TaxID=181013 RepID=UPI002AAA7EE3|nr:hypothetical protein [uncultured Desulfuromonas sp.]